MTKICFVPQDLGTSTQWEASNISKMVSLPCGPVTETSVSCVNNGDLVSSYRLYMKTCIISEKDIGVIRKKKNRQQKAYVFRM